MTKKDDFADIASSAMQSTSAPDRLQPTPDMRGRANRHTSGYWALTIPALSVRYLAEGVMDIFKLTPKLSEATKTKAERAYSTVVGGFMMGVSLLYMKRTYDDIRSAFAESVGWEAGKSTDKVTMRDLMNSDNSLLQAAKRNFFKYNTRRFAVNLPFFSNHVTDRIQPKNAVLFGVAANSLYLMSDVLSRKETFFERLQTFVDEKIKHTEQLGDKIRAIDLINLYELHSRDKNPNYAFSGRMDSPEWQDRVKLFGRMAELLNQTYGNEPNKEGAEFTLSKMIYLMGHDLVTTSDMGRSMAYVEAANRPGITAVKDIAAHERTGGNVAQYAEKTYGISGLPKAGQQDFDHAMNLAAGKAQPAGFAERLGKQEPVSHTGQLAAQRAAADTGNAMKV